MKSALLLVILLVAGCASYSQSEGASETANSPTTTVASSAVRATTTTTTTPGQIEYFEIETDDNGFRPSSIDVASEAAVTIVFVFNDANIYYGDSKGTGMDIKSSVFSVEYRKGTGNNTKNATFTAESSFTATSYWPSSGVSKGTLKVNVA